MTGDVNVFGVSIIFLILKLNQVTNGNNPCETYAKHCKNCVNTEEICNVPQVDRPSHTGELRESGRQQVLETIRLHGEIARIDIARETGVSPATVTAISSELLEAGLIREVQPENKAGGKRGRPRVSLALNGAAHKLAGIKVGHDEITVLIIDFEGKELVEHDMPLPTPRMEADELCRAIMTALEQTCAKGGFSVGEVSGLCVGLAGLVDAPRNFVYWSSSLTSRNVDLGAHLGQHLDCAIFVENDANLVAKAEHLFGKGRDFSDFIVITIEHGVGMGIVLDDQIYRGTRGCGAEFGHTKVQLSGALCQCGQRGCLEAYVGDYAILREASLLSDQTPHQTVDSLHQAARQGDELASSIFDRAGRMFAMGLANVINIFDPELIIVSGTHKSMDYLITDKVIEEMRQSVVQVDAPLPEVIENSWGNLMWAKGAAAYAVERVSAQTVRRLAQNAA